MWIAGYECYADLIRRHRSDVDLTASTPVKLHVIAPGCDAVMAAEGKSRVVGAVAVQIRPSTNQGRSAISADDPSRAHNFRAQQHALGMQARDRSLPEQGNTS